MATLVILAIGIGFYIGIMIIECLVRVLKEILSIKEDERYKQSWKDKYL